ncbi:MAG: hypothetical protein QNJ61_00540 [Desulfobacterales bacterium]|nr:hypothetical protein [Desulfobacterales bacterium]
MTMQVDYLKKVDLRIEAGAEAGRWDLTPEPQALTLICGTASTGICPFEYELMGKTPGERVELTIAASRLTETMAHLLLPLRKVLGGAVMPPLLALGITIEAVTDPNPREVIRAMAEATNQEGCGGDCDCGCGGH